MTIQLADIKKTTEQKMDKSHRRRFKSDLRRCAPAARTPASSTTSRSTTTARRRRSTRSRNVTLLDARTIGVSRGRRR